MKPENGEILRFVEKPKDYVSNKINSGIYLFNPSILDRIELRPTSIEKETFPQMAKEGQLFAMELSGYWMDVGQPKDYLLGMSFYLNNLKGSSPSKLRTGSGFMGLVLVDDTTKIGEGCMIGPNVTIGPNCVIEDGVRLRDTSVLEGAVIGANSWVKSSIIGWQSTVGRWTRIENVSVLGQDVHVDDELYVNGGKILPHKTISESIYVPSIIM